MTDTNIDMSTPTIPPLLATYIHDYSQKALTAASIFAITHGAGQFIAGLSVANQNDLISSVVQIGTGVAGIVASCAWTLAVGYLREKKMKILLEFNANDK